MYFSSDYLQCISYNLHKLRSIYTLGSRFEVAPFPPSALSPLTLSLPSAPSTSSMAPKRAVAKRLLQRTGATRPAAALAEAIWVAADAELAASIAARQEAECAASVASQQSADEEAAKHDAEFRRVAAENDARRAALAQSALVPLAPLDAAPTRRPPMPPPQQVEERLRRQALAQAAQEDLRRRRAAQRWQAAQPTGRAEVTPKSAPPPRRNFRGKVTPCWILSWRPRTGNFRPRYCHLRPLRRYLRLQQQLLESGGQRRPKPPGPT